MASTVDSTAAPAPALDAILLLEQPFAHLPYDQLCASLRTQQRLLTRELRLAQDTCLALAGATTPRTDTATAVDMLDHSVKRLKALKRRLAQLNAQTKTTLNTAAVRYAHLQDLHTIASTADPAFDGWSKTRLNRILVDYMLRRGANSAAAHLTSSAGIPNLVDTALFAEIDKIEASLQPSAAADGGEHCARALAWCAENRPALEAVNSRLEFDLRMQVYIELARTRTPSTLREAIAYLREHLLPMQAEEEERQQETLRVQSNVPNPPSEDHLGGGDGGSGASQEGSMGSEPSKRKQISRLLGLLACPPSSPAYGDLYHPDRWAILRALFRSHAFLIHSLPPQPMLHIALSAGLSSLKLPACYASEQEMVHAAEVALLDSAGAAAAVGGHTARAIQRATEVSGRGAVDVSIPEPALPPPATTTADGIASSAIATATATATAATGRIRKGNQQNPDCPICEKDGLGMLAREVPWSHHENSTIVCRLSGHVMTEDDPPLCLPNGRVYSRSALEDIAFKSADGQTVTDPRTGESFAFASLRKMYIS
ncbi:unnamed protein product [Tilletia laevis]|uniref:CTLH domain-containing protein n=2 Tax=Tilletia TaxID=13289 RepID=A0A177VAS6_9BASI|nr:hypothetical protein CF336_g1747 [Tilletia laevis]KAE8263964.1 hypothetical protein A4X03_0g1293 [Tilletia caries]KAE8207477.1 hypothetical protein CF335_g1110 [Tilletia laevis]CAD6891125.1 unnamed protein product [Tilletia caries]CAD6899845.1 unnamed protein product [Tilletia caries]